MLAGCLHVQHVYCTEHVIACLRHRPEDVQHVSARLRACKYVACEALRSNCLRSCTVGVNCCILARWVSKHQHKKLKCTIQYNTANKPMMLCLAINPALPFARHDRVDAPMRRKTHTGENRIDRVADWHCIPARESGAMVQEVLLEFKATAFYRFPPEPVRAESKEALPFRLLGNKAPAWQTKMH